MHFIPSHKAESHPSDQFQSRREAFIKLTGLRHRNRPRAAQRVDVLPWDRGPALSAQHLHWKERDACNHERARVPVISCFDPCCCLDVVERIGKK